MMSGVGTVGVVAFARETFDVDYAEQVAAEAFAVLDDVAPGFVGGRELLFDEPSAAVAIETMTQTGLDALVVLQATFTDASMAKMLVRLVDAPIVLWAFPEDRVGGRLRLNSLCGINLAGYALGQEGRPFRYLYTRADDPGAAGDLRGALAGEAPHPLATPAADPPSPAAVEAAAEVAQALGGLRTGVIGDRPVGFYPSQYDPDEVERLTGVTVQRIELAELFAVAEAAPIESVEKARATATDALGSLDDLDESAVDRSLRLYCGMQELVGQYGWSGFATRCWPECFTEFGGAACTPHAMLTNAGIPGGCEADVYGTLTSLVLRELSGESPFVADLVDLDPSDDTGVFWHCGLAPVHMADPVAIPHPIVHTNRQLPLLNEFPLKPGRVTIARLSQAGGSPKLMVGSGEMLRAPLAFSGTAGVVRFDRPAAGVLDTIMGEGLEHHYGIVYGSYAEELRALAAEWSIPVVALT